MSNFGFFCSQNLNPFPFYGLMYAANHK